MRPNAKVQIQTVNQVATIQSESKEDMKVIEDRRAKEKWGRPQKVALRPSRRWSKGEAQLHLDIGSRRRFQFMRDVFMKILRNPKIDLGGMQIW
jgi:hypothetical protein